MNRNRIVGFNPDRGAHQGLLVTLTLVTTACGLLLINELLLTAYTPPLDAIRRRLTGLLTPWAAGFSAPEPLEQTQVAVLLVSGSALSFVTWTSLRTTYENVVRPTFRALFVSRTLSWCFGLLVLALVFLIGRHSDFYYQRMWVPKGRTTEMLLATLPAVVAYYGLSRTTWQRIYRVWTPFFVCLVVTMALTTDTITDGVRPHDYHFNPVVYPLAMVRAAVPIGSDVLSLYGFYPLYIAPIVGLLTPSIETVSLIMVGLTVACFLGIAQAVRPVMRHPYLIMCVSCAAPWVSWFGIRLHEGNFSDPYYQYVPIRVLFPVLVLVALGWRPSPKHRRRRVGVAAFLATTGLFWNLDSGIACVLSVVAFALAPPVFKVLRCPTDRILVLGQLGRDAVVPMAAGSAVASVLFVVLSWLQTGSIPAFSHQFATIRDLSEVGYSFLPVPRGLEYWQVMALCLLACGVLSFPLLWNERRQSIGAFQLAVSVMGLALLVYYFGRSHHLNLFGPSWIIPIALGLMAERLQETVSGRSWFSFARFIGTLLVAYLCAAVPASVLLVGDTWDAARARWQQVRAARQMPSQLEQQGKFIREHAKGHDGVMIFSPHSEGVLFLAAGVRPAIPVPSSTDLLLQADLRRIIEFLRGNTETPVFVVAQKAYSDSEDITKILQGQYTPSDTGPGGITMLVRNPGSRP